jgi:large repetitive protein
VSYQAEVLADNPVLYLRYSETSGATCADTSASGFVGTARGTFTRNVATGQAGWGIGISLNGSAGSYVDVPDAPALDQIGAVTYEFVIKPTSLPAAAEIMSKGYTGGGSTGYSVYLDNTGTIFLTNSFYGGVYGKSAAGAIVAGTEYYVAVTRNAAHVGVVYVNAVASAPVTLADQPFSASGQPLTIGSTSAAGSKTLPFPGLIDETAIYPTDLSQARISAHFAARDSGTDPGKSIKSPPGILIAALAHERNTQRREERAAAAPASRRVRLDYLHKRGKA